jgi:hypothetical protein
MAYGKVRQVQTERPGPPIRTYHAHPVARLYLGALLPALGALLIAIPGWDSLTTRNQTGLTASGLGLTAVCYVSWRLNSRTFWQISLRTEHAKLVAKQRSVRIHFDELCVIEMITWPFPANHLVLHTKEGRYALPPLSKQEDLVGELLALAPSVTFRG